jgi:transglutaminase-like putative cysteine protease
VSIHVALNHVTHYRYDRRVALGPQVVRLRPAPHCRTHILSYSLRVEPAQHFINWQQDPFSNHLARLVFPEPTREFKVTVDLVAEMGLTYICDLFHDDQPGPVKVRKGRLTSVPYSLEMNDVIVYNINLVQPRRYADILKRQFDRLYAEGEKSGTVMCIPLHPYLVGQPYRMAAFEEALSYITSHDKVWLATGREIARHFNDHHYDAFAAAAQPVGEAP